jgi:hypothetical protein
VTPGRARGALLALVTLAILGLAHTATVEPPPVPAGNVTDIILHRETIATLRRGESYYAAVGTELRRYGYPSLSVFNWRTPLHYRLVAMLSIRRSEWLMKGLALLAVGLAGWALAPRSRGLAAAAMISLLGAMLLPLFSYDAVLLAEIWTGILIALSLAAYYRQRWVAGALLGTTAVFMRELAAPYALVCGLLAIAARRRAETWVWIVGGIGYAVYFSVHAFSASHHMQATDLRHQHSWVQFQGLTFILLTLRNYGWLMFFQKPITPLSCAFGLAAMAAPSMPPQLKYSLAIYVLFFGIVGQSFNYYWGFLTTPIWGYAFLHSVEGLKFLLTRARRVT